MPARRTVLPFPSGFHATPNWGAKFKVIFRIEKAPVWRAVYHASRVRVPNRGAVASGNETTAEIRHISRGNECLYWSNRLRPSLCKSCLPTFAGSFGCVVATSATDLSSLSSTGVARKAWISPT
jgi:hypothetical protein